MIDGRVDRALATDPRIANKKQIELHTSAILFMQDAEALGNRWTAGQYFLLMHAIELALKSFLHGHGYSLNDLSQKFGHDLDKLLAEAKKAGLTLSQSDTDRVVAVLNEYAIRARLRYEFSFQMPLMENALRVAHGVASDTRPTLPNP